MSFCKKCGRELSAEAKFCDSCGVAVELVAEVPTAEKPVEQPVIDNVIGNSFDGVSTNGDASNYTSNFNNDATPITPTIENKKIKFTKRTFIIIGASLLVLIIIGITAFKAISLKNYEDDLFEVYDLMLSGAETAERYATLESKVWRNCIYENSSSETDKYTKNEYGYYYDDFNDALTKFREGENLDYSIVLLNTETVDIRMSELKDYPSKFEDEYMVLKELYIAYSELTDLVLGDTSYSCNSFTEALDSAISNYKNEASSAKLLLE